MNWLVVLKMMFWARTLEIRMVWPFGFVAVWLPALPSSFFGASVLDLDSLLLDLLEGAFSMESLGY